IPRRRTQTILIVIGLMLSTLIIAAALGTGDTINNSVTESALQGLGEVDELVVASQDAKNEGNVERSLNETFSADVFQTIDDGLAGDPDVDGIMPILLETLPVIAEESGQSEPVSYLVGVDPSRLDQFGGLRTVEGDDIDLAATAPNEVVISETMAEDLAVGAGDVVTTFYRGQPLQLTVAAVAEDSPLSGRFDTATPGWVVPLDRLQAATNQQGLLTMIAISNRGGVRDGLELSDAVTERARALVAGQPLGVDPYKDRLVNLAETFSSIFTGLFLVLGLFSIAVGILLIVLIFTMLAAERRPEMGMARAIGQRRGHLVQQFVAEGSGYALLAGLVGAALGVAATWAIGLALDSLFGDVLPIRPEVTPRSLVVAYCLGVVITFIAVVGSSWKISRLNVVAAIRDLPDVSNPKRRKRTLLCAVIMIMIGAVGAVAGQTSDTAEAFLFYGGMSLVPFGVALLLRFFGAPSRPVFSLVGIYILTLWLLPPSLSEELFGDLGGGFEMFFLSGIFMVAGASILIVQNLDLLLRGVSALGGLFQSKLPAVRMAIAYPGATKGRTGMLIAMFSLIVFSLATFATINQNFVNLFLGDEANAGWDVRVGVLPENPVGDGSAEAFTQTLEAEGVDVTQFQGIGTVTTGDFQGRVRVEGTDEWKSQTVNGAGESFITGSALSFQARAEGYADDAAVLEALRTRPDVAIVDASAVPVEGDFGRDPDAFVLEGYEATDGTFAPIKVEVERPGGGEPVTLTVIGVIDDQISSLFGLYAPRATVVGPGGIYQTPALTSYYVKASDPDQASSMAKAIEAALLTNGAQAVSIRDELEEFQSQNQVFLYIIQGFMGLGLLVGIAAVGVIAFRSVVERRQQIGMLRALGYQRSMVATSFLIETLFVVGIGVISGLTLGLVLAWQLFTSDDFGGPDADFIVPWSIVVAVLIVTIVAALLMTWVPSRQASRLSPAEALRYE
ncbi:MAG TPA: FtsX-like permease family protein, partial [Thermomicrobiales bacterium]|nr:FtsX-like permease family protein [Thermomicrobiales bacterium]